MLIRVYIVEDHPIMRETLVEFLGMTDDLTLCGVAETAEQAERELEATAPEVVLLDLSLPGRSGLDLLHHIQQRWRIPCVILSGHAEPTYVGRALAAGARGYLLKGRPQEVAPAIRRVLAGEIFLSDTLRRALDYGDFPQGAAAD